MSRKKAELGALIADRMSVHRPLAQRMAENEARAADPNRPAAGARVRVRVGPLAGRVGTVTDADIDGRQITVLIDDDTEMPAEIGRHFLASALEPAGDDYGVQGT